MGKWESQAKTILVREKCPCIIKSAVRTRLQNKIFYYWRTNLELNETLLSKRLASGNYEMPFKALEFTRSFLRAGVGWADVGKKQKDAIRISENKKYL